jgi:ABC-type branched-subunit amino acid transport system ATPase component
MAPNVAVGSLERSEPIKAPGMAADRVYVLERGRIVWEGGPSRFGMEAGAQYL